MDWILENLFWIILIGGGIASWLNNTRKKREEQERKDRMPSEQMDTSDSSGEAREMDIRKEILRKIAGRRGLDDFGDEDVEEPRFLFEEEEPTPPPPPMPVYVEPVRNQGELMLEQLKALEAETVRNTNLDESFAYAIKSPDNVQNEGQSSGGSLSSILKDNNEIRRAIILREVLGPPIGLPK